MERPITRALYKGIEIGIYPQGIYSDNGKAYEAYKPYKAFLIKNFAGCSALLQELENSTSPEKDFWEF